MKFQHFSAFAQHLNQSIPTHAAHSYLIISPCRFEGRKICDYLTHLFCKKGGEKWAVSHCDMHRVELPNILEQLNTRPLLGEQPMVVCNGIEKLNKNQWQQLASYIENPSPFGVLILHSTGSKLSSEFYHKLKKELVVLDLSEEKPWERRSRFERYLVEIAQRENYRLSPEAAGFLLDHLGLELAGLEQELRKLMCYVGECGEITLNDLFAVSAFRDNMTLWQMAEAIVWGENMGALLPDEIEGALALVGALRYQLQLGLQLASMLIRSLQPQEIALQLPQLKRSLLDKRISETKKRGSIYFHQGMIHLFDLEFQLKNGGGDPLLLFDLFKMRWARALHNFIECD